MLMSQCWHGLWVTRSCPGVAHLTAGPSCPWKISHRSGTWTFHWKKQSGFVSKWSIRQFEIPPKGSFNAENDEQLLVQGTKWIPNLRQPQIQQWSVNCETAVVLPLLSKALGQGASDLGSSPHNLESCAEDVLETLLGFFSKRCL